MGRYSLWVQVPLMLAATVAVTLLSSGLMVAALHDAPPVAKFCGGFAFLLTVQWAWRRLVLSCRPTADPPLAPHPRPRPVWATDLLALAERLLTVGESPAPS